MATILCVDDEPSVGVVLEAALTKLGHTPVLANSVDEAMKAVGRQQFELIISDYRMPSATGLDLLSQLEKEGHGIPVIIMTGYSSVEHAVMSLRSGAIDYLTKPAEVDEILRAFEKRDREAAAPPDSVPSLARTEWEHINRVLTECNGNVSQAARLLGIHRRSLQRKLAKYPVRR